ncbi:hypothetical protein G6F31_017592 [Rhizopus arrhizus]|nr:hypothetical protein G6F31_017592 [Rhizopus arrhizus]
MPACAMIFLLRHAAAGSFDRGLGTRRGSNTLPGARLGHFALADDLGLLCGARDQLGSTQGGEVDLAGRQLVQRVQQHFSGVLGDRRTEADLRQTTLHGGLAAFEASLDLAATRTGARTRVAAAGSLAQARADTATDAGALGAGARCRAQFIETQSHDRLLLNLDEVVNGVDQTANLRAVLQFTHIVELVQAQRTHRQAVTRLGTTQAAHQAHLHSLVGLISHG